jgi:hypothetical protein
VNKIIYPIVKYSAYLSAVLLNHFPDEDAVISHALPVSSLSLPA